MKVWVLHKKTLIYGAVIIYMCIALLILVGMLIPKVISAAAEPRKLPVYSVGRDDKKVSLSFDAAWGNEDTQNLIDILNKYKVHATFFVVASWVDKYPESVKALSDNGEEVMNHSATHPHMPQLSRDQMLTEITTCDDKIAKITGKRPTLFRAPFGDYNNTLIETLTASNHYCIQWDVDSLDWKEISAPEIQQRVLPKVKSGSIILFHNAAKHTPEALPGIIDSLQKQGYTIVPISQLIYKDNYTINHEGRQIPNQAQTPSATSTASSTSPTSVTSEQPLGLASV